MARVLSVTAVHLSVQKSNPPTILVVADGTAGTPGWKNLDLNSIEGTLSADGILDLELVGTPPSGISIQLVRPVSADFVIQSDVERIVGVAVHSRTNTVTQLLGSNTAPSPPSPGPDFGIGQPGTTAQLGIPGSLAGINPGQLTTFAIGEEGHTTFGTQFAESPPLSPHVEKFAIRLAETLAINGGESWAAPAAEKFAVHPAEKLTFEKLPAFDNPKFPGGEGDPGPDPVGPMFFSPFGVR